MILELQKSTTRLYETLEKNERQGSDLLTWRESNNKPYLKECPGQYAVLMNTHSDRK